MSELRGAWILRLRRHFSARFRLVLLLMFAFVIAGWIVSHAANPASADTGTCPVDATDTWTPRRGAPDLPSLIVVTRR